MFSAIGDHQNQRSPVRIASLEDGCKAALGFGLTQ
jgi:hypothetical protein